MLGLHLTSIQVFMLVFYVDHFSNFSSIFYVSPFYFKSVVWSLISVFISHFGLSFYFSKFPGQSYQFYFFGPN